MAAALVSQTDQLVDSEREKRRDAAETADQIDRGIGSGPKDLKCGIQKTECLYDKFRTDMYYSVSPTPDSLLVFPEDSPLTSSGSLPHSNSLSAA